MSGGQMRRASLAIGVALNPGILLLDEPTANLDIATRREIMAVLEDMKDIIHTAVIATHDMQLVCQWAERIIVLCGGRVVADGTRDEIFCPPAIWLEQVGIRPPEIFSMARLWTNVPCAIPLTNLSTAFRRRDRSGKHDDSESSRRTFWTNSPWTFSAIRC